LQYVGLAVVALLVLLAGGSTTFSMRPEYEENLKMRMFELLPQYVSGSTNEATVAWDKMQTEVRQEKTYLYFYCLIIYI
jgi:hypothetical protein